MLLYRVCDHLPSANPGAAGHPLYVYPAQGSGLWDNPHLYLARYLARNPEAAVAEAFGTLRVWTPAMLHAPGLPGSEKLIVTFSFDTETHPLLDLDDARELVQRSLRPTQVVIRDRPFTQSVAASVFAEGRWAGLGWWSFYRPEWPVAVLWDETTLGVLHMEEIVNHPALEQAAARLHKVRDGI